MIFLHGEPYTSGGVVHRIREIEGVSQLEFSERVFSSQQTVSLLENMHMIPRLSYLEAILGCFSYSFRFEKDGKVFREFSDLLAYERYRRKFSIKELTDYVGVSSVSGWVRGHSSPSIDSLFKASERLGFMVHVKKIDYSIARHNGHEYEDIIRDIPDEKSALELWQQVTEDIDLFEIYEMTEYDVTAVLEKEYGSDGQVVATTVKYYTNIGEYELKRVESTDSGFYIVYADGGTIKSNARRLTTREEAEEEIEALKHRCIFGTEYYIVEV